MSSEALHSGTAVRVRKLTPQGDDETSESSHNSLSVEYHIPVPGAMAELFDAIAASLTWTE
ncbi:hypothetical protein [Streptomyces luteogriseus]|uniref:hypothetical protein n=1 Tax=Streptomyces luteogriseus TaxID=68233 RepID=UPI0037245D1D